MMKNILYVKFNQLSFFMFGFDGWLVKELEKYVMLLGEKC